MKQRAEYKETLCRSALNKVTGMPFAWSLNPYRGCVHGCHYCYARRYHAYFDLNAGDDFTGIVFVKTNVAEVLREELSLRSWHREDVALGTATDPYQPIEGKYRLTRRCLEAFAEWRSPVNIVTKGPMVIRDLDVLQQVSAVADASVYLSITTLDESLVKRLEPTTAPPRRRLRAVEALAAAGVRVGVLIAPIIPGMTDRQSNLDAVVSAAKEHGASLVGGRVLELRPGTKEHFFGYLAADEPGLFEAYAHLYRGHAAPKERALVIHQRLADACERYGMPMRTGEPKRTAEQMTLAL